ncbi:hypothetical protein MEQU1_001114 [Malassezia equina]|uniref:DUF3533 domain-containing protein n=1 Tax=Malassezia equina TaxID=1381935 RepID=A0AAF0EDI8_9BASI|nr:hypothetical protein MEQU1_001114 [Malassezia equina]
MNATPVNTTNSSQDVAKELQGTELGVTTFMNLLIVWLFCSIYWGSLYRMREHTPNLNCMVLNRDHDTIGDLIVQSLLDSNHGPLPHNTWVEVTEQEFPTSIQFVEAIEPKQEYWAAIEIHANATQNLLRARQTGDASWDPQSVMTMYYASARNSVAIPSLILSPTQSIIGKATSQLATKLASQYLSAIGTNAAAIQALSQAPQTLVHPVDMRLDDLRPWTSNVGLAPTFVGMIYLVILSFQVVLAGYGGRMAVQKYLHYRGLMTLRLLTTFVTAFPLSLMFTLLDIPFELPFGGNFSYGGGFMVYWLVTYCGICVFSLALESAVTILTPRFIGFFLIFFIISNVSVSNFPVETASSFYLYGYAMPFYNLRQVYLAVLFRVGERTYILLTEGSTIMKYVGIIWAWMFSILITYPVFVWLDYRKRRQGYLATVAPPSA